MTTRASVLCVLATICTASFSAAYGQNIGSFNPFPELPYEATSYAQDEWIDAARRSTGRGETASLEACQRLLEDETTPWDIQRWALRRRVELLTYTLREWDALREGRDWLEKHPEDPDALLLRFVLLQTACQNGHKGFEPDIEDVRVLLSELLRHHDPLQMLVVKARVEYARKMQHFEALGDSSARVERSLQLEAARSAAHAIAVREDASEQERAAAAQYLQSTILPMLAPPPPRSASPRKLSREEFREEALKILRGAGVPESELEALQREH